jgi:uncharacterized coiled-coil protein SlyX
LIIGKPSLYILARLIFVKLVRFGKGYPVNESLQARLEHLEALYSEQEYTVQALNDTVAQQDREIARLTSTVERLKDQLLALKTEVRSDISSDDEKPPHY